MKKLSPSANSLLESMQRGLRVIVRATTGRASHSYSEDCTNSLLELKKHDLIEIERIDRQSGWITYKAKGLSEEIESIESKEQDL